MKIILIILLGVCLFAYFSIRKATLNPGTEARECQDKEKYKELLKKEKLSIIKMIFFGVIHLTLK